MLVDFEELDFQQTPLGDISLRRRSEPRLDGKVLYEVKLGEEFLMSSLFTEAWLSRNGAGYLDGTIFCFPSMLGDPESIILIGGNQSCYEGVQKYLNPLGGDLRFLGANIGASLNVYQ